MTLPRRYSLSYTKDSSDLFSHFHDWVGAIFLDSAKPYSDQGRYDIFSAEPINHFHIRVSGDAKILSEELAFTQSKIEACINDMPQHPDLPFSGGAIGYLGYDVGEMLHLDEAATGNPVGLPPLFIGIYDWVVVVDHQLKRTELVTQSTADPAKIKKILALLQTPPSVFTKFSLTGAFTSNSDIQQYQQAFNKTQDYIYAGDCYQINLSRAFSAKYHGQPWAAYLALRKQAAAPFSAYINLPQGQVLSVSPERFLAAKQGLIFSQPIKGTAPRSPDPIKDTALAESLRASEKNRAENVMIVDLIRNDLSKNCRPGSVKVDKLCELQSFETVHHLVSTVSGTLKPEASAFTALIDAFPGGSITGAPKKRAMEIIRELEPHQRGLYCGSVFYLAAEGRMDSNILIRSFVCENGEIKGFAGGGIVADSNMAEEFDETNTKINRLLDALAAQSVL